MGYCTHNRSSLISGDRGKDDDMIETPAENSSSSLIFGGVAVHRCGKRPFSSLGPPEGKALSGIVRHQDFSCAVATLRCSEPLPGWPSPLPSSPSEMPPEILPSPARCQS